MEFLVSMVLLAMPSSILFTIGKYYIEEKCKYDVGSLFMFISGVFIGVFLAFCLLNLLIKINN